MLQRLQMDFMERDMVKDQSAFFTHRDKYSFSASVAYVKGTDDRYNSQNEKIERVR